MTPKPKLPPNKNLRDILWWAEERQRVYVKRQNDKPWPWTKNPIMSRFRFCCTYREDDWVTKWIRVNWREPYAKHPNLWLAMLIARQINWPNTLGFIGFPEEWKPDYVAEKMKHRQEKGHKVFTSAYMIHASPEKGKSKIDYVIYDVIDPVWKAVQDTSLKTFEGFCWDKQLETVHTWLTSFNGWGPFMAYEVVTDLRHTRYLQSAIDINTWANTGPGAKRGLNRLYNRNINAYGSKQQLLDEMRLVNDWITRNRNTGLLPTWEIRDTEHLLCEYDKKCRAAERIAAGKTVGLEKFHHNLNLKLDF